MRFKEVIIEAKKKHRRTNDEVVRAISKTLETDLIHKLEPNKPDIQTYVDEWASDKSENDRRKIFDRLVKMFIIEKN